MGRACYFGYPLQGVMVLWCVKIKHQLKIVYSFHRKSFQLSLMLCSHPLNRPVSQEIFHFFIEYESPTLNIFKKNSTDIHLFLWLGVA
jgi:hypothetical protein